MVLHLSIVFSTIIAVRMDRYNGTKNYVFNQIIGVSVCGQWETLETFVKMLIVSDAVWEEVVERGKGKLGHNAQYHIFRFAHLVVSFPSASTAANSST